MTNQQQKDGGNSDFDVAKAAGPLGALMPADIALLNESRRLLADNDSRVDSLATICMQDPIILIELLKKANALFFAGGRDPITSTKMAIVRLGSDVVREVFESLTEREQIADSECLKWFQVYRSRSRRIGIVCRIFSEAIAKSLNEDCQAIGSMFSIGDMLAVYHFQEIYAQLAEGQSRTTVNYKLATAHKFDVELMGLSYLRRNGIPEALLFALDRESRPRQADRAIMKPLCMAAMELVDAFDNNKWERLAPGKKLAPKSAIRLLQMSDAQYLKIYERTSEYLFSARMIEEKQKRSAQEQQQEKQSKALQNDLQSEIDSLLGMVHEPASPTEDLEESPIDTLFTSAPPLSSSTETVIKEVTAELGQLREQFALKTDKPKVAREQTPSRKMQEDGVPQLRTKGGTQLVSDIAALFDEVDTSEELLTNLLQKLVDGPFEKAALIVVSQDRKSAIVVAARGPIGNGQRIEITDPLSPLAQCFSKVQSFSSRPNEASPFGCKSFAVAPIDADHDTPVALYADCGAEGSITFEARRIFRTVVNILNEKLPSIPGGIPVELQ